MPFRSIIAGPLLGSKCTRITELTSSSFHLHHFSRYAACYPLSSFNLLWVIIQLWGLSLYDNVGPVSLTIIRAFTSFWLCVSFILLFKYLIEHLTLNQLLNYNLHIS